MGQHSYVDLDLVIERQADRYRARVVDSPAGSAEGTFAVPFTATQLQGLRTGAGAVGSGSRRLLPAAAEPATPLDPRDFGSRLFDAVFAGEVGARFTESLRRARGAGQSLRVRLRLDGAPDLHALPWEYLYSAELHRFLTLSTSTPVVRHLPTNVPVAPARVTSPLRVLVMVSRPAGVPELDVRRETELLRATTADLADAGLVELVFLERATLQALQRRLYDQFHVFHFSGHGRFDPRGGEDAGALVMETESGAADLVTGTQLGTLLQDAPDMQLAVLNACEGARASGTHAFAGVAQSLVLQGLPAVVAMQDEITDLAALGFAHEFYFALSRGRPVDAAVTEARKALYLSDQSTEWATPVLLRSGDGEPFTLVAAPEARMPTREDHWKAMYDAAGSALAAGQAGTAAPLLERLAAERPGYADVTQMLEQVRPAGRTGVRRVPLAERLGRADGAVSPATPATGVPAPGTGARAPRAPGLPSATPTGAGQRTGAPPPPSFDDIVSGGSPTPPPPPPPPTLPRPTRPVTPPSPPPSAVPQARWRRRLLVGAGVGALAVTAALMVDALSDPAGDAGTGGAAAGEGGPGGGLCDASVHPDVLVTDLDRETFAATCVRTSPVVDGSADEWPAQPVVRSREPVVAPADGTPVAGTWRLAWDADALYVLAEVTDPELTPANRSVPSSFWKGDGVSFELGPDVRGVAGDAPLRDGDVHLMIGVVEPGAGTAAANRPPRFGPGDREDSVAVAVKPRDGGYVVEAAVPWAVLGVDEPAAGTVLGMNVNVSDARPSDGELRAMVSSNPFRSAANQQRPATWDLLVLAGDQGP